MPTTFGAIPIENITTIRTNVAHYDDVRNVREVVDRHQSYVAFEHDMLVLVPDKGRMKQEVTVRVLLSHVITIEANVGEPVPTEEPIPHP